MFALFRYGVVRLFQRLSADTLIDAVRPGKLAQGSDSAGAGATATQIPKQYDIEVRRAQSVVCARRCLIVLNTSGDSGVSLMAGELIPFMKQAEVSRSN
jgi:hypothetical protein